MRGRPWDYLIIGSGFGGSVSALRLAEKGYRVVVLEKGRRFGKADFPKSNWDLKRWMWQPQVGAEGLFKMTFLPHVTVLSGVGVGGGSLVYANTLPVPSQKFFRASSWAGLVDDWERELEPHYATAQRMLGATQNRFRTPADEVLEEVARDIGRPEHFQPSRVGVYFGTPGVTVADPYFDGAGPRRTGCTGCGGCMLGCRVGAKNTLDQNYLYLAERLGVRVDPRTEVTSVRPLPDGGYRVEATKRRRERWSYRARNVIFAGGVMGSVDLLLRLKEDPRALPQLSDALGQYVRTNSEALISVTSRRDVDLSRGVSITSILHTDENSHIEPCRYPAGSGFFRLMAAPHVGGDHLPERLAHLAGALIKHPLKAIRAALVPDWAKRTMILLYMQTLEGHLQLKLGRSAFTGFRRGLTTTLAEGPAPKASLPTATDLARRVAAKIEGAEQSLLTETLLGIPSTAHILGGCCMGASADDGVIDDRHRVFGYDGLYVVDGSAVSANPGVNPSLTITALAERAMSFIPPR